MSKNEKITRISLAEARRKIGKSRLIRLAAEQKKEMKKSSKAQVEGEA